MKLQGPMFSLGASGSIAGTVTFATWKGRPYARQLVVPHNPKSALQVAFRAMFKFLSQNWAALGDADKASWQDLADAGNYSTFNAYMKYNQDLWGRFDPPVVDPTQAVGTASLINTPVPTAGVRSVSVAIEVTTANDGWGIVIYRKAATAPTGIASEVVGIILGDAVATYTFLDTGLTPGIAYHYKAQTFTDGGLFGALSADSDATPTS